MPISTEPATMVPKSPVHRPQGYSTELFFKHAKVYAGLLREASQISKRILETPFSPKTNPETFAADTIRFSELGKQACDALALIIMLASDSEGEA